MRFTLKNPRFLQYIDYQNVRKTEFLGCQSQEDQQRFNTYMNNINKYRADAHAKSISDEEMSEFRVSATKIEGMLNDYL